MALDLQTPNFSGTAAIAGRGISNLNLDSAGALGLQALQIKNQRDAALRQAALEKMRLQQEGSLALGQQDLANRGLLAQENQRNLDRASTEQLAAQEMAFKRDQAKTGIAQIDAQRELEAQKYADAKKEIESQKQMAKLLDEKKETIQEKGAFAAYGLMASKQLTSPAEFQAFRQEFLTEALNKGYIDDSQAKQLKKVPRSQFEALLGSQIMQFGMVKEYQDQNPQPKGKPGEIQVSVGPEGFSYSSSPTTANTTKLQGDIINSDIMQQQIENIQKGFDPNYFTYRNRLAGWTAAEAEKFKGTPGAEGVADFASKVLSGKTKKEQAEFLKKRSAYMSSINQVFDAYRHLISGAAIGEKEIEMLKESFVNGEMSPSEALGSLEQIRDKYKDEAAAKRATLASGIQLSGGNARRQNLINQGFSAEQVDDYLRRNP